MDNTFFWFSYSRFKWLLVAVLAKLVLAILCNDKALVSHDGQSGFVCFWTSMVKLQDLVDLVKPPLVGSTVALALGKPRG